jgi:DMSO/TMAO reductase YedYZ molybdopterin-dependent catalytic subunit
MDGHSVKSSSSAAEEEFIDVEVEDKSGPEPNRPRFAIARYPTTVETYSRFIEAGGYRDPQWWSKRGMAWLRRYKYTAPADWGRPGYDHPRMPVTGVSFWEAEAYARFRGAELPTEHEWYLVASNGGLTRYPWGNDEVEADTDHANLSFFGAFAKSGRLPVDRSSKSASSHGVCDLIGNAAEWCLPGSKPALARGQRFAVLRGGASWHVPGVADASFRDVVLLTVRDSQAGIRLVRRVNKSEVRATASAAGSRTKPLGRSIKRPSAQFRQEGLPAGLTEESWRLAFQGLAGGESRSFTLSELKRTFPGSAEQGLFVCVCRWGQENNFTGVRLRDFLDALHVPWREQELYLLQRSVPGDKGRSYEASVPIRKAVENQALLAWEMDGQPLTLDLGWPLRYIDFSLFGYKGVKCLSELIVTTKHELGWWERECQYDIDGTIMPGTITVVGDDALRFEIGRKGRVRDFPWRRSGRDPENNGHHTPRRPG